MPTLPIKPTPLLSEGADAASYISTAWCMLQNTAASDLTGHPAINVPCGFSKDKGLPHGTQLVGRYMDESTLFQAASVIEAECPNTQF